MRIILFILLFFSLQSQAQIINASPNYRPFIVAAPSCDADAKKFIDSTEISGTEATAICTLVQDLKDSSLWTSMKAIYPMVGGTATTQKWNLKDVRNLDAAFRLSFNGGWTHSSTGALPNGSAGYANTNFLATSLTANSSHFCVYLRTNTAVDNSADIGCYDGGTNLLSIYGRNTTNYCNSDQYTYTTGRIMVANYDSRGFYISSRIASNSLTLYKNGIIFGSASSLGGSLFSQPFYLGAMNINGTAGQYSNRELAFATIGTGLTSNQSRALNTIVEKFNDALSRGVQ